MAPSPAPGHGLAGQAPGHGGQPTPWQHLYSTLPCRLQIKAAPGVLIYTPCKERQEPWSMPDNCPFCTLKYNRIVAETELTLILRDGYPVSPGHTLIVTRRHVGSFFEVKGSERGELMAALAQETAGACLFG